MVKGWEHRADRANFICIPCSWLLTSIQLHASTSFLSPFPAFPHQERYARTKAGVRTNQGTAGVAGGRVGQEEAGGRTRTPGDALRH